VRRVLPFLLCLGALAGCQGVRQSPVVEKPVEWMGRAGDRLQELNPLQRSRAIEAEIDTLFGQSYIDPLTDYLREHRNDERRADALRRVLVERERRCAAVGGVYAARDATEQNLQRFRRGYSYSCPRQVADFAQRVDAGPESGLASEGEPGTLFIDEDVAGDPVSAPLPAKTESAVDRTLNDCYLLTTIRNYSEASQVCEEHAAAGDLRAQVNMATIARALGEYGNAATWALRAAPASGVACFMLGELYAEGLGVTKSDAEARRWFSEADRLGHPNAGAALQALGRALE